MRVFLRLVCWVLLVAGSLMMGAVLATERTMTHALWALPVHLTMIIMGFLGLMVLYLVPDATRVYAMGVQRGIELAGGGVVADRRVSRFGANVVDMDARRVVAH